jgi:UDP-glucose 4-epimerase
MHYLITGGAGFIGSHLADAPLAAGHTVHALDNLSTGRKANVQHLLGRNGFRLTVGNVLDVHTLEACMEGAARALRTGGVVVVIVPNFHDVRRFIPSWRERRYWQPHCHIK